MHIHGHGVSPNLKLRHQSLQMHLESLIDDLGGFGPYQRYLIPVLAMFKVNVVPSMMIMMFAGVEPDWWCALTDDNVTNLFSNGSYKNCEWNLTCNRHYGGEKVTIVSEWDLVCDSKWINNAIISIQMVGVLLGAVLAGYASDSYGRKKVIFTGLLLSTLGNLVAAFSVSWPMFTIFRFILGASVGIVLSVVYLYQVEFVGKNWRAFTAAIPSWGLGFVIFAALAWLIQNWKWVHLASAAINFPLLISWFFIPESVRWLTVKGHLEEARRVVIKMAAVNKKPVPDTSILELIAEEERADGDKAKNYNYLDLFKTKNLAWRTCFTCFIWFSMSIVYYAISFGVRELSGDFYLNLMIMALLELPVFLLDLLLAYVFSRRLACAILFALAGVSCFGVAMATRMAHDDIRGPVENGFAIASKFFAIGAWSLTHALTSEQFPTVIRNLAYAAQNTVARLGGILAAQVFSLGVKNDLMPPFVAMGILMALTALSCFTLEETSNKALEDTMEREGELPIDVKDILLAQAKEETEEETNGAVFASDTHSSILTDDLEGDNSVSDRRTIIKEGADKTDDTISKPIFRFTVELIEDNDVIGDHMKHCPGESEDENSKDQY